MGKSTVNRYKNNNGGKDYKAFLQSINCSSEDFELKKIEEQQTELQKYFQENKIKLSSTKGKKSNDEESIIMRICDSDLNDNEKISIIKKISILERLENDIKEKKKDIEVMEADYSVAKEEIDNILNNL